jgi:ubiquinone/menaquinone biosynthesis C-methylase UbiE
MVLSSLERYLPEKKISILEFGSGSGYQIRQLEKFGQVIASDVNYNPPEKYSKYVVCDIKHSPFPSDSFELIFANHVLEHIEGIETALEKIKKIGTEDCVYAFTMPTRFWLIIGIPAHYYQVYKHLIGLKNKNQSKNANGNEKINDDNLLSKVKYLFPRGHPVNKDFIESFREFGVSTWKQKFKRAGFKIITVKPLLSYGPSEWPVISTRKCSDGFCPASSMLYVLKKQVSGK